RQYYRDAALRPPGVAVLDRRLGHGDHPQPELGGTQRGGQPGHPGTDHREIRGDVPGSHNAASAGPSTSAGANAASAGPSTSAGANAASAGPSTSAGANAASAGPSASAGANAASAG